MPLQVIPVTNAPGQTMTVTLDINAGNVTLQLAFQYNEMASYWVMAISDKVGNLILDSVPLLTGAYPAANILGQFEYLQIGAAYVVNVSGTPVDYPNRSNLGTDFQLLWGDNPSYLAAVA